MNKPTDKEKLLEIKKELWRDHPAYAQGQRDMLERVRDKTREACVPTIRRINQGKPENALKFTMSTNEFYELFDRLAKEIEENHES